MNDNFNCFATVACKGIGSPADSAGRAAVQFVFHINDVGLSPTLDDGKIDMLIVKKDVLNTPLNVWKLFVNGIENYKDHPSVKFYSGVNIKVDVEERVLWNLDGDKSDFQNIEVNCFKRKIKMFVGD